MIVKILNNTITSGLVILLPIEKLSSFFETTIFLYLEELSKYPYFFLLFFKKTLFILKIIYS